MIEYNRTAWWSICFAFYGTVLPYIASRVGFMTLLCLALYLIDAFILKPSNRDLVPLDPLGHTVLGVALSMLIVFRTNSANSRFWEARSHWGVFVNSSRDLIRLAATYAGPADELARMVAAYVVMVREQLRGNNNADILLNYLSGRQVERLRGANNPASVLAGMMSEWIAERFRSGKIDNIMAVAIEQHVSILVDNQGGCEKIRATPLPFVYASLIKLVLLLYLATLPFVLVPKMGFIAPLVVAGVSLGMLGIEEAGVEIECPFALDPNHLPLESICEKIARDAADLAKKIRPE